MALVPAGSYNTGQKRTKTDKQSYAFLEYGMKMNHEIDMGPRAWYEGIRKHSEQ